MSTAIMAICWPLQGMSVTQKAVLISLADNANDEGVCWPSVARIAERTCLSERAVRNAINWLEGANLLSRKQRFGRSTYYALTPALYAPCTTCSPAPDAAPPRHHVPDTPAPRAPRTVIEPSSEPSVEKECVARTARKPRSTAFDPLTACPPNVTSAVWAAYCASRKKPTAAACELIAKKLAGHPSPDEVLNLSIQNGWTGIFPEKVRGYENHTGTHSNRSRSAVDDVKQAIAEREARAAKAGAETPGQPVDQDDGALRAPLDGEFRRVG